MLVAKNHHICLPPQYHYNSQTGQYCYYDSAQQAYVAVDSQG